MKKLTVLYPDNTPLDLSDLIAVALELKIETVKSEQEPKKRIRRRKRDPNLTVAQCIMAHYKAGDEFTLDEAKAWAVEDGFGHNTAGHEVSSLMRFGYLERIDGGYRFVRPLRKTA